MKTKGLSKKFFLSLPLECGLRLEPQFEGQITVTPLISVSGGFRRADTVSPIVSLHCK